RYSANCGEHSNNLVAQASLLPARSVTAKEQWLLDELGRQLARGRNVLVFTEHTGHGRLVARYQRLIRAHLGVEAVFLDAGRVDTATREDWIRQEVVGQGVRVLIVNPVAVQTGLNCLAPYFKTALWLSLPYNALVYRQANGRLHRIGADPAAPIEVYVPVWAGTLQELALVYIAAKISASENLDGLSVESQLEAAGAAGDG